MYPVLLGLILFGSNKEIYVKADAIMAVYDVDCADPKTGTPVQTQDTCAVVALIGQEYMVTRITAQAIVNVIHPKKKK